MNILIFAFVIALIPAGLSAIGFNVAARYFSGHQQQRHEAPIGHSKTA